MEKKPKGWMFWTGWVLTALPSLMLVFSGGMKLSRNPELLKNMVEKFGFPDGSVAPIGVVELLCVVLYLVPQTAVLGATLLTAYLGGAVATHVRAGDPIGESIMPIISGIVVWGGLFLRDQRVRALLPLRSKADVTPATGS
jgi:hypothetical protein